LKQDLNLFKGSELASYREIARLLETKCPSHLINYNDILQIQTIVSTSPSETLYSKNLRLYLDPKDLKVICGYIIDAENDSYLLALG
jgi:hypothetical protein